MVTDNFHDATASVTNGALSYEASRASQYQGIGIPIEPGVMYLHRDMATSRCFMWAKSSSLTAKPCKETETACSQL